MYYLSRPLVLVLLCLAFAIGILLVILELAASTIRGLITDKD